MRRGSSCARGAATRQQRGACGVGQAVAQAKRGGQ